MKTLVDIDAFNAVAESEQGFDLSIKSADGVTDTGVILTVIGKHADAVAAFHRTLLNKLLRDEALAKRKGNNAELPDLDKLKEQSRQDCLVRVIGWKNVKQEFSKDALHRALTRNPHWIDQITEASDDLGNFTKAS